jgi:cytochrome c oxidase subunit 2
MINLLIILVVILVVLGIARIMRIFELTAQLKEEDLNDVTESDNKFQSRAVAAATGFFILYLFYQIAYWSGRMLPVSASDHGLKTDMLLNISFAIIIPMFVLTHVLLAYFGVKYYGRKDRKATFFAHSTKLEMIWTSVPTVVLTTLIIYGISTWNEITEPAPEEAMHIELYAKQFDWTARYSGEDNELGRSGYRLIKGANIPGVDMNDDAAQDDKMVKGEIHIPIGRSVNFVLRSRDVIHSAYMPHFRAQMNCVPGMTTNMHFVPNKTTAEMQADLDNDEFQYLLLCNKICGSAHYNMQMNIVVDTQEDYDAWYAGKKTMAEQLAPKEEEVVEVAEAVIAEPTEEVAHEEHGEEEHTHEGGEH